MNSTKRSMTRSSCFVLLLTAVTLGGCASTGYEKAEVTSRRIDDSRKELVSAKAKINDTVTSLNDLVNNPQPDLRPQYKKFAADVDDLTSRTKKARDRVVDMKAKREAYIQQWQTQASAIENPQMRSRAMQRIDTVRQEFDRANTLLNNAKSVYTPFLNNLQDLQRYLGSDLTTAGIQSIKSEAKVVTDQAPAVLKSIDDLIAELDKVSQAISPVTAQSQ